MVEPAEKSDATAAELWLVCLILKELFLVLWCVCAAGRGQREGGEIRSTGSVGVASEEGLGGGAEPVLVGHVQKCSDITGASLPSFK